jgi:isopentenyldiphosphate isomerase
MQEEMVDIVDDNDEVIGNTFKQEVYLKGLSNRIVHVFVVHPDSGEIFIQKRSASIRYLPNFYCTSAGGHVSSGEEYKAAAARELEEELGLTGDIQLVEKFIYNCPENTPTKRFICLYAHYAKDGISYSDGEVSDGFLSQLRS